jgi:predicted ATPase/DNA-binding CsgD family transcriptional regulator
MIEFLHSAGPIPVSPTPLIGRDDELAVACDLLRDPRVRLISLIGPAGVGKTRLALELAQLLDRAFADGVSLISLETVTDAGLARDAITGALGLHPVNACSPRTVSRAGGRRRDRLLVLDNFEHLLAATPVVAEMLAATPGLTLLVTSREALRLRGEHRLVVPPLALPAAGGAHAGELAPLSALAASPAVALFAQRARAARSDFMLDEGNAAAVAALCARLDGLPLAIELAAARIGHLSPAAILGRIDRQRSARLSLLSGGPRDAPPRQRSLRDAIAWSHDRLGERERILFRRLGVLASGFTIEAAAAVCAADAGETLDGIRTLLDKSLLDATFDRAGEPRFSMLETTRAFAWEQLATSGEETAVRRLLAAWRLTNADSLAPGDDRHPERPRRDDAAPLPTPTDLAAATGQPAPEQPCLTPREWDVLRLLAQGLCDKEIGALLTISPQTATKHVGNLLHKLGVPSRTAATALALRRGYV